MLQGGRVFLRLLEKGDLPARVRWINDPENIQTLLFDWPTSLTKTEKWFQGVIMDDTRVHFSVVEMENDRLIGMTGLLNIHTVHRHAQFYLTLGEKDTRGKRLPDEILPLLLEFAFVEKGLQKVYAHTLPNNEKARAVFARNGFHLDGVLRRQAFCRGSYQNIHVQSILAEEWETGK